MSDFIGPFRSGSLLSRDGIPDGTNGGDFMCERNSDAIAPKGETVSTSKSSGTISVRLVPFVPRPDPAGPMVQACYLPGDDVAVLELYGALRCRVSERAA